MDISIFRDTDLFFGIDDEQLRRVAEIAGQKNYAEGEEIFREGEAAHTIMVIRSGDVDLLKRDGSGVDVKFDMMTTGAVLGEMTLVNMETRSVSARAATAVETVELPHIGLSGLLRKDLKLQNAILLNIARTLARRLRETNRHLV